MEAILLLIRIVLAAVFAVAAVGKLLDRPGAEKAARDFGVPDNAARPLALWLPVAELFFALLLLPVSTAWFGAFGAFALLAAFTVAMIRQMQQGNAPDCHCFGAFHSEPVSPKSLIRNVALTLLALLLVVRGWNRQGLGLTDLTDELALDLIFGLAIVALLGAAVHYLKTIGERQTEIVRRLDVMEWAARQEAGSGEIAREGIVNPNDGLPIGSPFPDFELPDLKGRTVSFDDLLIELKPMLFFFVSPNCAPCQALLPEIGVWQKELAGRVEFVFLSRGGAEENAEKFGAHDFRRFLLQNEREVADAVRAQWTPTALLVGRDGRIVSHVAAGDEAIRELVAKISAENLDRDYFYFTARSGNGRAPKIGETVPELALRDLDGREIKSADFEGRRTLVAFWSTTCPHCRQMIADLQRWEREKAADEPDLIVFSEGDPQAHREFGLQSPIVLDEGYREAQKLGMYGTPSAVLVDERGRFASETAVGAPNIWALVGKGK